MRFSRIHVMVIGLLVIGGLLVAFALAFVRPQLKLLAEAQAQVEEQKRIANTILVELKSLADAQADLEAKQKQAYAYMARMPAITNDPHRGMVNLWTEYAKVAGEMMAAYFASRPGVARLTGFSLPPAPTTPLEPVEVIQVPVGDFAVQAVSLPAIIQFLRDIGKAPRMATVANVSIQGTSPNLAVTMPLTMYLVTSWARLGPGQQPALAAPKAPAGPAPPEEDEEDY